MEPSRVDFKKLPETSLAALESLSLPLVHEVVLSADIRCAHCQKRLAVMMAKMKEIESVIVNVREKKVTLICRYPPASKEASSPIGKVELIRRIKRWFVMLNNATQKSRFHGTKTKYCCMMLKINIDCNGCCRKVRRIVLNMKEVETHMIEKQQCRISVCGRFRPSDVAIKMRKKMKRRVEILEIQEFDEINEQMEQPNLL